MKTIKILKLLVITISFCVLNSCDSDDSVTVKRNEVKVNANSFEVTNATLFDDGTYNGITEFELLLTGSGITIASNRDINGHGGFLTLTLFSNEQTGLAEGDYSYDNQNSLGFILNRGGHILDYDASLGDGQTGSIDIESGDISVTVENSQYTITIDLTDELGNNVTGYYNGDITILD